MLLLQFVRESPHSLSELKNHRPFHHHKRLQLRRLISEAYQRTAPGTDVRHRDVTGKHNDVTAHNDKTVSFVNSGFIDDADSCKSVSGDR